MIVTIDIAVLLAIVIILRLRRRTQARSRNDELATVLIVLVFGVLIAGTATGRAIYNMTQQVVAALH